MDNKKDEGIRIVAIISCFNEENVLRATLENYLHQCVDVFLIDNESTDDTYDIAKEYVNQHVVGIERIPRNGQFNLDKLLRHKEFIADQLKYDWFMHADADEIRLPPRANQTIRSAVDIADKSGFNLINFIEYTFIPVREHPDHDHPDFQRTMRWYYPFVPVYPHRSNLWKRRGKIGLSDRLKDTLKKRSLRALRSRSIDLVSSSGHRVTFPGFDLYPVDFKMRHYQALSLDSARRKYNSWNPNRRNVARGMHGWRANFDNTLGILPCAADLQIYTSDDELDHLLPRRTHFLSERRHIPASS